MHLINQCAKHVIILILSESVPQRRHIAALSIVHIGPNSVEMETSCMKIMNHNLAVSFIISSRKKANYFINCLGGFEFEVYRRTILHSCQSVQIKQPHDKVIPPPHPSVMWFLP
jgi:hypothetical protein